MTGASGTPLTWAASINDMRGRRGSGRFQAIIDLTSLLDVVFIVLLVVICHQRFGAEASESRAEETYQAAEAALALAEAYRAAAEAARAEAENARDMYNDRNDTYENISNYVSIYTIHADYTAGKPEERFIRILGADDDEILSVPLTDESEEAAFSALGDELSSRIESAEGRPVIFSINLDRILYRDEIVVENLLTELEEAYDNVIFK